MEVLLHMLLLCIVPANAFTKFTTNCTVPDVTTDYVSAPNTRGSLQLIWTSLSTILLCTYSILHLDIPEGYEGQIILFFYKLMLSLFTIILPEFLLVKSIWELLDARATLKALHRDVPGTKDDWTLAHMLYANMGGFVVRQETDVRGVFRDYFAKANAAKTATANVAAIQTDAVEVAGREAVSPDHEPSVYEIIDELGGRLTMQKGCDGEILARVRANTMHHAILDGVLPAKAPVNKQEILDKSKSDIVTKSLALLQLLYFFVQLFARLAEGLPVTQMELMTASFGAASLIIYLCWMPKPQAVQSPTTIAICDFSLPADLEKLCLEYNKRGGSKSGKHASAATTFFSLEARPYGDWRLTAMFMATLPFGAIHIAGWNLAFPSTADKWLWRASAIASSAAGPVVAANTVMARNVPFMVTVSSTLR